MEIVKNLEIKRKLTYQELKNFENLNKGLGESYCLDICRAYIIFRQENNIGDSIGKLKEFVFDKLNLYKQKFEVEYISQILLSAFHDILICWNETPPRDIGFYEAIMRFEEKIKN